MEFKKQQDLFISFMEYYNNYLKKAHIIAKNNDDKTILNVKSLGNNFKFYSLDEICKTCSIFYNSEIVFTPKTIDAMWFKKCENESFYIYLIEFKGDKIQNKTSKRKFKEYLNNLNNKQKFAINTIEKEEINDIINNIKPLYNKYSDSLLNSLILKPLETITTALPLIYKDYCEKNNNNDEFTYFDIVDFLRKAIINYYVIVIPENEDNLFRSRTKAKTLGNISINDEELTENYKNNLKSYYERYKQAGIINSYNFIETNEFNNFVQKIFMN